MKNKTTTKSISIPYYNEDLLLIKNLKSLIYKNQNLFHSVIVHGSVATNEIIPYSDFDGLLILKDNYAHTKQLQKFKLNSFKEILKFDPLQHHGWFQLKESDLENYPEAYFPSEILKHSRCIYPKELRLELNFEPNNEVDYKSQLFRMLESFERRIENNWHPINLYQLKSFLSEIMLLPSLYYSVFNNKGIFKKESFIEVNENFTIEEWYSMQIATEIRKKWNYKINFFQKIVMTRPEREFRKATEKIVAPKINGELDVLLDQKFYLSLEKFIYKIRKDISQCG